MKERSNLAPVPFLEDWFKRNLDLFRLRCTEINFTDTGHGSAYIDLDTNSHISRITSWDHALCLDIEIIEIETEQYIYFATGSCDTMDEFDNKLSDYLKWLKA